MVGISFYSEVYNCNQTKEGEMNMKKKILLGLVLIFRLMDMGLVVDNLSICRKSKNKIFRY